MEILCFWFIHIRSNPNPVNCCFGLLKLWYHLLISISTFIDWYFLDKWDLYVFFSPFIAIIRMLLLQYYWVLLFMCEIVIKIATRPEKFRCSQYVSQNLWLSILFSLSICASHYGPNPNFTFYSFGTNLLWDDPSLDVYSACLIFH